MIPTINSDFFLHSINQLVFTVDNDCDLCELRTEFLCIIYMKVNSHSFKFHFNTVLQRANCLTKRNLRLGFFFQILNALLNHQILPHFIVSGNFYALFFIALLVRENSLSTPFCFRSGIYC